MFRFNILNRFLMRRFFGGVGLVMLVVCGIIVAVTFVERLPSNPTMVAALLESWIRLLEYMPLFLPLAVFMGTLLASYNLTKSSEKIIIASAGLSPYQSARPFLLGAAIIGFVATMVVNPYAVNLSAHNITDHNLKLIDDAVWLREATGDGYITMRAGGMLGATADAMTFSNATVYVQDAAFRPLQQIQAEKISLTDEGLATGDARIWDKTGRLARGPWAKKTRLTPRTVLDRYLQPDQISFWQMPAFIKKMTDIGIPMRGHLVQFWTLLFLPLTMIAMATLGVAFSQTRQRRNYSFGVKFSLGIVTCFALYFLTNLFNALGATGALPPMLSVIAPPLIIIAAAGVFIASFDAI